VTWPRAAFLRRIRDDVEGDPARPHLVAATTASVLVGTTGALVLAGLHRRAPELAWPLLALGLLLWAMAVVVVLDRVLPWQTLVVRGLRRESRALAQVRATERERRRFHLRWLGVSSAWAMGIAGLPVLVVAAAEAALLGSAPQVTMLEAAASIVVGCLASNVPTLVACAREARCASARTGPQGASSLPTRGHRS
jgi:hypothetical protein